MSFRVVAVRAYSLPCVWGSAETHGLSFITHEKESCHIYKQLRLPLAAPSTLHCINTDCTTLTEPFHTWEGVILHLGRSHNTRGKETCHTYKQLRSPLAAPSDSCHTCECASLCTREWAVMSEQTLCYMPQHAATRCNTLQHTATHTVTVCIGVDSNEALEGTPR